VQPQRHWKIAKDPLTGEWVPTNIFSRGFPRLSPQATTFAGFDSSQDRVSRSAQLGSAFAGAWWSQASSSSEVVDVPERILAVRDVVKLIGLLIVILEIPLGITFDGDGSVFFTPTLLASEDFGSLACLDYYYSSVYQ
jgi:hypothetical protein